MKEREIEKERVREEKEKSTNFGVEGGVSQEEK